MSTTLSPGRGEEKGEGAVGKGQVAVHGSRNAEDAGFYCIGRDIKVRVTSGCTSRVHRFAIAVTFAPARPASDRQWNEGTKNSPPVALALSRLLSSTRNTSSGRHEVADPDDRRDGRPRHAFIVELRTPRATAARSLAPSSPSRVDLSPLRPAVVLLALNLATRASAPANSRLSSEKAARAATVRRLSRRCSNREYSPRKRAILENAEERRSESPSDFRAIHARSKHEHASERANAKRREI